MSGKPHYSYAPGIARDSFAEEGPSPSDLERADDARYQGDFLTLVAGYRIEIEGSPRTAAGFAEQLRKLAKRMTDDFGPGGLFEQTAFSEHGPQIILRAFARAYEAPEHVLGELEGD